MLKVGLIGSVSSIALHLRKIQNLPGIQVIGKSSVGMIGQAEDKFLSLPECNRKELVEASDIIVLDQTPLMFPELLVFAIKNNKHIFINDFPDISPEEVLGLSKLAEEAKTAIHIRNPFMDEPITDWLFKNKKEPSFVSFFDAEIESADRKSLLLKYLFYATAFFDAPPQKMRVSGIAVTTSPFNFINIRLDYATNSTFNLELLFQSHLEKTLRAAIPGKFLSGDFLTGTALLNNRNLTFPKMAKDSLTSFLSSSDPENFNRLTNLNGYITALQTLQQLLVKIDRYTSWN